MGDRGLEELSGWSLAWSDEFASDGHPPPRLRRISSMLALMPFTSSCRSVCLRIAWLNSSRSLIVGSSP